MDGMGMEWDTNGTRMERDALEPGARVVRPRGYIEGLL